MTKQLFQLIIFELFPPVEFWFHRPQDDPSETASKLKESLRNKIDDYSGNRERLLEKVEQSYRYELERGDLLDSKAENYIRNTSFVLGLLTLTPVLTAVIRASNQELLIQSWPELAILVFFLFGISSLLLSVFYSSEAIRLHGYALNFTAKGVKEEIEKGDYPTERMILHFIECKAANEVINQKKAYHIFIAEGLSRNGLIIIGIVIITVAIIVISVDVPPLI